MKCLTLYFHTSSNTKVAHLRYLLSLHSIDFIHSKSFVGYPELQTDRASDSLRAGAEYIRSRFASPFIIEDTEVRIEAYKSLYGIVYPGFDVKRWWRTTSFEELDSKCDLAATRRASQSSNICLSVPGLEPMFFRGTVHGSIALEQKGGLDNPDIPWLNSREFGSIFIPDSASKPFVFLSLEESLRFDFRKRAVDQLAKKIKEISTILNLEPSCYSMRCSDSSWNQMSLFEDDSNNSANQLSLFDFDGLDLGKQEQ